MSRLFVIVSSVSSLYPLKVIRPVELEVTKDKHGFIGYVTEVFGTILIDGLKDVCHLHAMVEPSTKGVNVGIPFYLVSTDKPLGGAIVIP